MDVFIYKTDKIKYEMHVYVIIYIQRISENFKLFLIKKKIYIVLFIDNRLKKKLHMLLIQKNLPFPLSNSPSTGFFLYLSPVAQKKQHIFDLEAVH